MPELCSLASEFVNNLFEIFAHCLLSISQYTAKMISFVVVVVLVMLGFKLSHLLGKCSTT
jgi:hypothetical protein